MKYIKYFENWKDQGEANSDFEEKVLGFIKDFNWDIQNFIKKGNSIEDLLDPQKVRFKNYRDNIKVSFTFSHIKNGKRIYFYDITIPQHKTWDNAIIGDICESYLIEDNKCIGVCLYELQIRDIKEDLKYYVISDIGVVSKKRRKGYGRDIINHIEKLHPGYSYFDDTATTIKGDRFFHKVKGSPLVYKQNEY